MLMLGSVLISISFFAYNYSTNKEYLETKANQKADWTIERLSQNLVIPLWEVDSKWVGMITDTEILADDVKAICIIGEGDLKVSRLRGDEGNIIASDKMFTGDYFIKRSVPVMHNGNKIGDVNIFFSDVNLRKELTRELTANASLAILIILFLMTAPILILDRIVLFPLNKILTIVKNADKDNHITKAEVLREDQIGLLANEFNNMMENIKLKEKMMLSQSRQAAMGEMISMIAHQWRQPITAIAMGANSILLDIATNNVDSKEMQECADKILQQTFHLSKTIEDFKNFFSPDKNHEFVDVNEIIEETFSVVGKSLEYHNITLIKEYAEIGKTAIYPRELLQVVLNILNNAKEALVELKVTDPTISITSNHDEKNIYISICNNGYPIKDKIIHKIFEPYFTTKDKKNGTGLGLYMCKTIIEKHFNGSLTVQNKKKDGVCFNISFPKIDKVDS